MVAVGCSGLNIEPVPSYPMKVFEIDISKTNLLSDEINDLDIDFREKTLLRFIGRNLKERELKFLWARFSAKTYPLLRFSPRYPNYVLQQLFHRN